MHAILLSTRVNASGRAVPADPLQQVWRQHERLVRQRVEAKPREQVRRRYGIEICLPATRPGQESQQRLRLYAGRAQCGQARVAVPLGQPSPIWADYQRDVAEAGRMQAQCFVEQKLARRLVLSLMG